MSHKIRNFIICFIIFAFMMLSIVPACAQDSGFIWIKTFKPGSADLNDETIDKKALAFVDSLMQRDDINFIFLGGSDMMPWKQANGKKTLSNAWDEGKKLERARQLRIRYGRGDIGLTDEPIRGIKVVWGPNSSDLSELGEKLGLLEDLTDSLKNAVTTINNEQKEEFQALRDSLSHAEPEASMASFAEISTSFFESPIQN